jgi:hypothetical protein
MASRVLSALRPAAARAAQVSASRMAVRAPTYMSVRCYNERVIDHCKSRGGLRKAFRSVTLFWPCRALGAGC